MGEDDDEEEEVDEDADDVEETDPNDYNIDDAVAANEGVDCDQFGFS